MTNKEAKDVLQEQIDRYGQEYDAEGIEALEIAINVLEQQPCKDAISRAEILKYAQLIRDDEGIVHEMVHVDDIKDAPSVTWSGWKSVTWELPEPNTAVLLYVKYKSSGQWTYQLGMWDDNKLAWEDWRTPYQLEEEFEVIAWMELPERYEEDNHE